MPAFKDPSFQERTAAAARARSTALSQFFARPRVDEAVLAERTAARLAREAAEAEKRAAARLAKEEAEAAKRALALAAAAEAARSAQKKVLSEAERKAARDARYAARKSRKLVK